MSDEFDDVQDPVLPRHGVRPPQVARPLLYSPAQVPRLIAEVYAAATGPLRARLLECLLRPVGPLALAGLAAGAFGAFLHRGAWRSRWTMRRASRPTRCWTWPASWRRSGLRG